MKKRKDKFYDKEFKYNSSTLTRRDLESFPCPFCAKNISDAVMGEIIKETDLGVRQIFSIPENVKLDFSNESISEAWWVELETAANHHKIPYYEDL